MSRPIYLTSTQLVWDALVTKGFHPHGRPDDFRCVCTHPGADNPTALHVWNVNGEARMTCWTRHCDRLDIIEPLGLRVCDLYPPDNGHRRPLPVGRRKEFTEHAQPVANILAAVDRLDRRWQGSILFDECPSCEWPHARIVFDHAGHAFTHCGRGCPPEAMTGALAESLRDLGRGR